MVKAEISPLSLPQEQQELHQQTPSPAQPHSLGQALPSQCLIPTVFTKTPEVSPQCPSFLTSTGCCQRDHELLFQAISWCCSSGPSPAAVCEEFITQIHEEDKCQAQGADGWSREMELSRILAGF